MLYRLIVCNDLNVLFSSVILNNKKNRLARCEYTLFLEHTQCKQHVTFIHKIILLLRTFRAPAKSVPGDSFYLCEIIFFDRQCLKKRHIISNSIYKQLLTNEVQI
jgi:hypothetical protein